MGKKKSVIDMVLTNKKFWHENMEIDKGKEIFDFSDHNLIRINFKIRKNQKF